MSIFIRYSICAINLTLSLLVANAVTLTFQIIVTGKPLIEEGCHITGFFIVRLFHKVLLPWTVGQQIFLRAITSRFNYTAPDSHLSAGFAKDSRLSFTIHLHETQKNCSKGICAIILEYRLYNKRPSINVVGRCFFQRIFTCDIFFAIRQFIILHSNPFQSLVKKEKRQIRTAAGTAPRESHPGPC